MTDSLLVDFWNVGYGDGAVIWLDQSKGQVILVDCGPKRNALTEWVVARGIQVEWIVPTHSHADHFDGLLHLLTHKGREIQGYHFIQDQSISDRAYKNRVQELWDGHYNKDWVLPVTTFPDRGPASLLQHLNHPRTAELDLLIYYPPSLPSILKQGKPNRCSSLVVLWFRDHPLVAWPGDLYLSTCADSLFAEKVHPTFLVGPHHGAPEDIRDRRLSDSDMRGHIRRVDHKESWISVAWHEDRKHPLPCYLSGLRSCDVHVRCSRVTKHCDSGWKTAFPNGIIPPDKHVFPLAQKWRQSSCMGTMRVRFDEDGTYEVENADAHARAVQNLQNPQCQAPRA